MSDSPRHRTPPNVAFGTVKLPRLKSARLQVLLKKSATPTSHLPATRRLLFDVTRQRLSADTPRSALFDAPLTTRNPSRDSCWPGLAPHEPLTERCADDRTVLPPLHSTDRDQRETMRRLAQHQPAHHFVAHTHKRRGSVASDMGGPKIDGQLVSSQLQRAGRTSVPADDLLDSLAQVMSRFAEHRADDEIRKLVTKLRTVNPFFASITALQCVDILKSKEVRYKEFDKHSFIFKEGDNADHFFIVLRGTVSIVLNNLKLKDRHVVASVSTGETFGEKALEADEHTRFASAQCATNVAVLRVPKSEFFEQKQVWSDLQSEDKLRLVASVPLFSQLKANVLMTLAAAADWRVVNPRAEIVSQGSRIDGVYIVADGTASVVKRVAIVRLGSVADKDFQERRRIGKANGEKLVRVEPDQPERQVKLSTTREDVTTVDIHICTLARLELIGEGEALQSSQWSNTKFRFRCIAKERCRLLWLPLRSFYDALTTETLQGFRLFKEARAAWRNARIRQQLYRMERDGFRAVSLHECLEPVSVASVQISGAEISLWPSLLHCINDEVCMHGCGTKETCGTCNSSACARRTLLYYFG